MLLVVDNYDSFTYNIVHYLRELGSNVEVVKSDAVSINDIEAMPLRRIVISPGPCTPDESGISMRIIDRFAGCLPLLGVCLGHQCIGQVYGADIVRAKRLMHGKTSSIYHNGAGLFRGLPNPFVATRYHSLVVDPASLPERFVISAWTQDDGGAVEEIMGISDPVALLEGVQFHPESIASEHGHSLLRNFLNMGAEN